MPTWNRPKQLTFQFYPISQEYAEAIAAWEYPAPFDVYNMPDAGAELVDPLLNYHVCRAGGQVAAFLCWGMDAQVPGYAYDRQWTDVGWGLAPELVSHGLGLTLIRSVLRFVGTGTGRNRFRATIAAFNERCRRASRRAGFLDVATFESSFDGRQFVIMHTESGGGRLPGRNEGSRR